MISKRRTILLKLSGELLLDPDTRQPAVKNALSLLADCARHQDSTQWVIVIGGGNFFRGRSHSARYGITQETGHHVGMLATALNGLILKELCAQVGLDATVLSAFSCSFMDNLATPYTIHEALTRQIVPIFVGGTGVPYVTTDTAAVIRAAQCRAPEVWKVTSVNGLYNADPATNPDAQLIQDMTYREYLKRDLKLLDACACALAEQQELVIRIFSHTAPQCITQALAHSTYGSTLTKG